MAQSILAVYEHGVLRPLERVTFSESQKVTIQIVPESINNELDTPLLVQVGLLTPPQCPSKKSLISKKVRRKLADTLARGAKQTLSEIVIEERGKW